MTKEDVDKPTLGSNGLGGIHSFETRAFSTDDLDAIIRINQTTLPENYPRHFFLSVNSSCPEAFRVAIVDSGASEHIIGYAMARVEVGNSNFSRFRLIRKGHIISVAVLKNFRRMKIATSLLSEIIESLKQSGAKELFLEVRASNIPAVSLYEKYGFQIVKRLRKYYRDGETAYLMAFRF